MTELFFESAGTRLFAVEQGAGPPVVLLHGGLATHASCAPYAGAYRLITPDLRASGRSVYAGALSWDLLADDVAALLRALDVPRAVIGGLSFGSGVALRVALRHPSLVAGLLLVHPVYGGAELGLAPASRAAMDAMHAAGRRAPEEGIGVLLPLFDALPPEIRERAKTLVATYDPASVATLTAFMASGSQPFAHAADLAAIAAPTLVVPGVDPQHPAEIADLYARNVPNCTLRKIGLAALPAAIADLCPKSS